MKCSSLTEDRIVIFKIAITLAGFLSFALSLLFVALIKSKQTPDTPVVKNAINALTNDEPPKNTGEWIGLILSSMAACFFIYLYLRFRAWLRNGCQV